MADNARLIRDFASFVKVFPLCSLLRMIRETLSTICYRTRATSHILDVYDGNTGVVLDAVHITCLASPFIGSFSWNPFGVTRRWPQKSLGMIFPGNAAFVANINTARQHSGPIQCGF